MLSSILRKLTCLTSLLAATPVLAQTPHYQAEFIAGSTGASASDLNQAGQVVGMTSVAGNLRGWVAWSGQPLALLPLPAGRVSSWANQINDLGQIVGAVGSSYSPEFAGVAALWTPSGSGGYTVQELGTLPGYPTSNATTLNNVGDVLGWSFNGMFRLPAQFFPGGAPVSLQSTGIFDPQSVNDSRVVVDRSADCKLLDLNTMQVTALGIPTGFPVNYTAVTASRINASNQVCGVAILATSGSCYRQSARYTSGLGWEIFGPCSSWSGSLDINASGEQTMIWSFFDALVELNGAGTFLIGDLIDAPVGQWVLPNHAGYLINDAHVLAGSASNSALGLNGVVLLTPVTGVGTPLCAGDGSIGACPCANYSQAGSSEGCLHSGGVGARLQASGSASVLADDLVLNLAQVPAGHTVVFLQGGTGSPLPFHDGLRCAGSPLVRLETSSASASGQCQTTVSIVTRGAVLPGMTRVYQGWFRDNGGPCASGSNISAGVQLLWQ